MRFPQTCKLFLMVGLLLLCAAASAQMRNDEPAQKDIDSVHKIYVAPFTTDDAQNVAFRAALKIELVHAGFVVLQKAEGSDATLNVEITSSQQGKDAKLEYHSMLDGGPDSRIAWHLSKEKQGNDMAKLVQNGARDIANSLHTYRSDVVTKNEENKAKQK